MCNFGQFFNRLTCNTCQPIAILGGLNSSQSDSTSTLSNSEKDSSSKAGETPLQTKGSAENMGSAVFRHDTLVGELTALETLCHLLITNDIKSCTVSIPDLNEEKESIDLYLHPRKKTKIKVDFVNGSPYIQLDLALEARILSIHSDSSTITDEQLTQISNAANQYLESTISSYLYKTAKDLNADISGMGKHALNSFTTKQDFESYNWLENYKNSFFEVHTDVQIKSGFLLNES